MHWTIAYEVLYLLADLSGVHERDLCVMSASETSSSRLLMQGLPLSRLIGNLARSIQQHNEWPIWHSLWLPLGLWNQYIMRRYMLAILTLNDGCISNLIIIILWFLPFWLTYDYIMQLRSLLVRLHVPFVYYSSLTGRKAHLYNIFRRWLLLLLLLMLLFLFLLPSWILDCNQINERHDRSLPYLLRIWTVC